jgi:hypothetical protein
MEKEGCTKSGNVGYGGYGGRFRAMGPASSFTL